MISEVENILNGQVERKVNADKVIGVSSANLLPDEKGEVPLSKQSAFDIAVVETPVAPAVETPVETPAEVTEELDLGSAPEGPAPVDASPVATPVEQTPAQAPTTPVENDTISEAPVDVVAPTELEGVDFNSIIPNIPLVDERPQETVEAPVEEAVKLPEMPNEILAEAPTTVDNNLFVDTPAQEEPAIPEVPTEPVAPAVETPATPAVTAEPVMSEVQPEPVIPETQNPVVEEPVVPETPAETESLFPEMPELPEAAQIPQVEDETEQQPEVPTLENYSEETLAGPEETSMEPTEDVQTPQVKEVEISNEKLDEIINKLNSINDSLDYIKLRFEERENLITETQALPQAPVMETTPMTNTTAEVPNVQEPAVNAPGLEVPELGAPTLEAPILEQTTNEPEKQEELVDALSQIPGYDVSTVDETPIKGGMFI